MRKLFAAAVLAGLGSIPAARVFATQNAFPGAQGFGATATGGRTGSVYVVSNLNDSGAGSFRDAVSQSNRIIVFSVGGYVNLASAVSCASNLTILGQTAPGQGVGFEGHEVSFSTSSNDIVQYIRAREGSADSSAKASINIGDTSNMILDHVSAEYSQYDNIDAVGNNGVNNVTIQNSMLADPIKAQQFNMHTEGDNVSYIANVWANSHNRNPLAKSDTQYVNNVIYNYQAGYTTGDSAGVYSYDIVNNYFIMGPSTTSNDTWYQLDTNQSAFSSGNLLDSNKDGVLNGSSTTPSGVLTLSSEWAPSTQYLPTLSAADAYTFAVAHAGDSLQRDAVDSQVITQVQSLGTSGSVYNTETSNGIGFGTITGGAAPTDTDSDGIPNTWETTHGLNPNLADSTKLNPLGYTMIEQYAQQLGDEYISQTWTNPSGPWALGAWSSTAPGIYDHALIRGTGAADSAVTISGSTPANAFSISIGGNGTAAGELLTVAGGSLTVQDTIFIGDQGTGTMSISGGTVRTQNVQIGNTVFDTNGVGTTNTGTLNITGGLLQTTSIALGGGAPGAWTSGGSVNWSGGTVQAIGALTITAPIAIGPSAATIDSNGNNGTASGAITGTGALTKIGAGTIVLSGNSNYSGGTNLIAGEIGISSDANIGGPISTINFQGGILQIIGTSLTSLGSHVVNTATFNGGFDIASSANTFTVSQTISGPGSLSVFGSGILNLTGTNNYTGGTNLSGGNLQISSTANIGGPTAQLNFLGGSLYVAGTTLTNIDTFNVNWSTFNGGFNIASASNVFSVGQVIGGSGSLTKSGPGVLLLNAANTFTGLTTVTGGTLRLGNALALQKSTLNLANAAEIIDFNGFSPIIGGIQGNQGFDLKGLTLTVGGNNSSTTYSGVISSSTGTGAIVKTGSGTLTLSGSSTYTGPFTISKGRISATTYANGGTASPIGKSSNAAANLVLDGGSLQYLGSGVTIDRLFTLTQNGGTIDGGGSGGFQLTSTGAIAFTGSGNRTLSLIGSSTGNSISFNLGDPASGATSLAMNGSGRWILNSAVTLTYSGDTQVINGTLLDLGKTNVLPFGVGKGNLNISSTGIFEMNGLSNNINALVGAGDLNNRTGNVTLTLGNGNAGGTFSGTITLTPLSGTPTLALVKVGAGTQIFSGTNSYLGTTTINAGVFQFNTAASIGGSAATVTVNAGAVDAAGYAMDQSFLGRIAAASTGVAALAATSANNLSLSAFANLSLGAVGSVSYTGLLTPNSSTYLFGGGGGTLTLSNSGTLGGARSVTIGLGNTAPASSANPLTLSVTAAQSYTGITTIRTGGTLSGTLNNGSAAGAAGISSNAASNIVLDGGTLAAIGATDRLFTLTSNGGALDNSGGINFTNTGAIALPSGNVTLTLTGTNTGHEGFSPALGDPASGVTSVLKSGAGKWAFQSSDTKTYSGDTHITGGTLEALATDAFSPSSNMVIDAGASLELNDQSTESIDALVGAGSVTNSFVNQLCTLTIGAGGGSGVFSGVISTASGGALNIVKSGAGSQTFSGPSTYVGSTTVTGGSLTIDYPGSVVSTTITSNASATLNINGAIPSTAAVFSAGAASFGASKTPSILVRTIGSLNLSGGVTTLSKPAVGGNNSVLVTGALNFGGFSDNWQGTLDVQTNGVIVHNASLGVIANQLALGFNATSGYWNGAAGILSTAAATDSTFLTTLGYRTGGVRLDGVNTTASDVLVKYTYYGDADLSGTVDGADYQQIDNGFGNGLTGWQNGDFNYDGVIDGTDYALIDNTFNQLAAINAQALAASSTNLIATPASTSAVPEPASLALLAVGALLIRRRRRLPGD